MHVDYELLIDELPQECINACSASGSVDHAVDQWRRHLEFTVDRKNAVKCLQGYGAWDADELAMMTDTEVAERILWIACCNFSDHLVGGQDQGLDVFVLE